MESAGVLRKLAVTFFPVVSPQVVLVLNVNEYNINKHIFIIGLVVDLFILHSLSLSLFPPIIPLCYLSFLPHTVLALYSSSRYFLFHFSLLRCPFFSTKFSFPLFILILFSFFSHSHYSLLWVFFSPLHSFFLSFLPHVPFFLFIFPTTLLLFSFFSPSHSCTHSFSSLSVLCFLPHISFLVFSYPLFLALAVSFSMLIFLFLLFLLDYYFHFFLSLSISIY